MSEDRHEIFRAIRLVRILKNLCKILRVGKQYVATWILAKLFHQLLLAGFRLLLKMLASRFDEIPFA